MTANDKWIYLDHHATTPVDSRVLEAMLPYFCEKFGNASSNRHPYGWEADSAVKLARTQVAKTLGCKDKEVIFTSGATESTNLALLGALKQLPPEQGELITSNAEHSATLEVAHAAKAMGYSVKFLEVDSTGQVSPDQVKSALTDKTTIVSLIHANNEIGSINPILEIGQMLAPHKVLFHIDACQSFGKIPFKVEELGVHLLSLSGHKIYAPKGIGALYVRSTSPRVRLCPLLFGASQEFGTRPGTTNVPLAVALGKACEIIYLETLQEFTHTQQLRDKLERSLREHVPDLIVNGASNDRLPNNLNVSVPRVHSDVFWKSLTGLAVSSGSACSSADTKTSHVLKAIGLPNDLSRTTVRFGIGRNTSADEIDQAIDIFVRAYKKSLK